jgi:hypothetical protein
MTTSTHLDPDLLARLRAGALDGAEARRLADHLAGDCDICDAFLASRTEADGLDGAVDAALLALAPTTEAGNDLEWARIRRRLGGARPPRRLAALAVAALALVMAGVGILKGREQSRDWDGVKGSQGAAAPVRLRFSVVPPGQAALERGASGDTLPAGASLLFRAEVGAPAELALLRVDRGGREVVWEGRAAAAGTVDVDIGGKPATYPLRDLSGPQRFALLAAPRLDRGLVEAALGALGANRFSEAAALPLSMDVVEVTVH